MIAVTSISGASRTQFDQTYAIVRSMKHPSPWIQQLSALSPSYELFKQYLSLRDAGRWSHGTFGSIYVPRFLVELHSPAAQEALRLLLEKDAQKVRIQLCCFCADETLCHRSIVAGVLQGMGAGVHLLSGKDYSEYYTMYQKAGT